MQQQTRTQMQAQQQKQLRHQQEQQAQSRNADSVWFLRELGPGYRTPHRQQQGEPWPPGEAAEPPLPPLQRY